MNIDGDVLTSVDCDYITARGLESDRLGELHPWASGLFRTESDFGNKSHPWGMAGFKGWKCGEVEIGVREKDCLVRLHSSAAARNWRRLVQLSGVVTRIDLQATVKVTGSTTERIEYHRKEALAHSHKMGGQQIVRRIDDNRGGYTLYLGARESNVFGRIYDKGAQDSSPHYKQCVRFEVQFNKRLAQHIAYALEKHSSPKPAMSGYLRTFLESRGVTPPGFGAAQLTYCSPRKRSDADRKLVWLYEAVRPSVLALIALGRGTEVLTALGLVDENESSLVHLDHDTTN